MPVTTTDAPQAARSLVRELFVANRNGIHARPASMIVRLANKFPSLDISAEKDGENVNAKSIMGLMLLAAGSGSKITFHVACSDDDEVDKGQTFLTLLEEIFNRKFDEP
ncbi:MAG: HPr family phosphocarrier protein [Puniceicoccales bacterium]|nr:HPr family phosphocarrier protein [Puniceicoccales bacterium]